MPSSSSELSHSSAVVCDENAALPTRSILTNAHEAPRKPASNVSSTRGDAFTSAVKHAFRPPQYTSTAASKTSSSSERSSSLPPLGKSFRRTTPLPCGVENFRGADVLPYNPHDMGITLNNRTTLSLLSPTSAKSNGGGTTKRSSFCPSSSASTLSIAEETDVPSSTSGTSDITGSVTSFSASSENHVATPMEPTAPSAMPLSSSTNPCSIRFAPLPSSGRLKRANSISIGVAARSQLLHSQGSGRQNYVPQSQHRPSYSYSYSGPLAPADVVDLGDEIRKGARKAWRKMRGASKGKESTDDSLTHQSTKSSVEVENKELKDGAEASANGKATSNVKTRQNSQIGLKKGIPFATTQQSSFDTSEERSKINDSNEDDADSEGAQTPRAMVPRRLSTGAFLGFAAIRAMQERRQQEVQDFNQSPIVDNNSTKIQSEGSRSKIQIHADIPPETGTSANINSSKHIIPEQSTVDNIDATSVGLTPSLSPKPFNAVASTKHDIHRDDGQTYIKGRQELELDEDDDSVAARKLANAALPQSTQMTTQAAAVEKVGSNHLCGVGEHQDESIDR